MEAVRGSWVTGGGRGEGETGGKASDLRLLEPVLGLARGEGSSLKIFNGLCNCSLTTNKTKSQEEALSIT